jgi:hypothetical protein
MKRTMPEIAVSEILVLLMTAVLPLLAIFLVVYVAVRLALLHEHRNHSDR